MEFLTSENGFGEMRFVAAASVDPSDEKARPFTMGVKVFGEVSFATDGYRMHAAPTPDALLARGYDGKGVIANRWPWGFPPTPDAVIVKDIVDHENVEQTRKKVTRFVKGFANNHRVVASVDVDPSFLLSVVQGLESRSVRITLYSTPNGVPNKMIDGRDEPLTHSMSVATPRDPVLPQRFALIRAMAVGNDDGTAVSHYNPLYLYPEKEEAEEKDIVVAANGGNYTIRVTDAGDLEITNTTGVIAIEAASSNRIILRRGSHQLTKPQDVVEGSETLL
jgi:hypothetical protein